MKNRNVGLAVTVPSCACCSGRIEEEVGAALRLPRGTLKFVVPLMAQLFYDPQVVELGKVVETLKERGCKVSVDRVQFGIPLRPLFLPQIWKIKVDTLSKELQGVMFASIDFGKSLIAVDYVPALVRPHEILDALLGQRRSHLEPGKPEVRRDESIDISGHRPNPERVRSGNVDMPSFVGTSVSRPCHDEDLGTAAARV